MNSEQIQEVISVMTDPVVRQMYLDDPKMAYEELRAQGHGLAELNGDEELKVVCNTADTFYFTLPEYSDAHLISDDDLLQLNAAGPDSGLISAPMSSAVAVGGAALIMVSVSAVPPAGMLP